MLAVGRHVCKCPLLRISPLYIHIHPRDVMGNPSHVRGWSFPYLEQALCGLAREGFFLECRLPYPDLGPSLRRRFATLIVVPYRHLCGGLGHRSRRLDVCRSFHGHRHLGLVSGKCQKPKNQEKKMCVVKPPSRIETSLQEVLRAWMTSRILIPRHLYKAVNHSIWPVCVQTS